MDETKGLFLQSDHDGTKDSTKQRSAEELLSAAESHKKKLLMYADTEAARSRVFDDQSDWYQFESNVWMDEQQKEEQKKKAALMEERLNKRRGHRVTLDLLTGQVVSHESDAFSSGTLEQEEPKELAFDVDADKLKALQRTAAPWREDNRGNLLDEAGNKAMSPDTEAQTNPQQAGRYFANDTLKGRAKVVYENLREFMRNQAEDKDRQNKWEEREPLPKPAAAAAAAAGKSRVDYGIDPFTAVLGSGQQTSAANVEAASEQGEFGDSSDRGVCLSMHQPWASLLIAGIKRFEGRGWASKHRGRLWIASTASPPEQDDIDAVEAQYREVYGEQASASAPWPAGYPHAALLGCVDMVDCLSNEDFQAYRTRAGAGTEDSASPYLFACVRPRRLKLPQRISGQHKMWHIDTKLLKAVQPTLIPVAQGWRTSVFGQPPPLSLTAAPSQRAAKSALDLWPPHYQRPVQYAADRLRVKPTAEELAPGVVVIRNYLSVSQQQEIVDICREYGVGQGGFYVPTYENSAHMKIRMFCLGQNWNLRTREYEKTRSNFDNAPTPDMPPRLATYSLDTLQDVQSFLRERGSRHSIPNFSPDILIVNFYTQVGKLGVHQDKDESRQSLRDGRPVVSLSVGDACDFVYGNSREELSSVRLQSGDALVFGGPGRHVYHGVEKVYGNTAPRELRMRGGRLNLTFRQH